TGFSPDVLASRWANRAGVASDWEIVSWACERGSQFGARVNGSGTGAASQYAHPVFCSCLFPSPIHADIRIILGLTSEGVPVTKEDLLTGVVLEMVVAAHI